MGTKISNEEFFSDIADDDIGGPRYNVAVLDLSGARQPNPEGNIYGAEKTVIISDIHMGSGRGDDLAKNGALVTEVLERYYLPGGWHLVLNGDVEDLFRNSLDEIRARWPRLFAIYDSFYKLNRLCKNVGNHDAALLDEKDYPYKLFNAVRIETSQIPLFAYHGHQSSMFHTKFNSVIGALIRRFVKPFGIKNISSARNPHRRYFVEKQAYAFALKNKCVSVIGHTHRPLFESLGRFEYIKFEIELLCRDYAAAVGEEKEKIAKEVAALRNDLRKLKKSERRDVLRQSLYGDDELPVPCLFNSGSAISKHGINAIELDNKSISLVYWFTEGDAKEFIKRGSYHIEKLEGTNQRKVVLNNDRLDYIRARIELLGKPL